MAAQYRVDSREERLRQVRENKGDRQEEHPAIPVGHRLDRIVGRQSLPAHRARIWATADCSRRRGARKASCSRSGCIPQGSVRPIREQRPTQRREPPANSAMFALLRALLRDPNAAGPDGERPTDGVPGPVWRRTLSSSRLQAIGPRDRSAEPTFGASRFQIESRSPAAYSSGRGYARGGARFYRRHF
jgi:hypothetical protein